ncbi:CDP-glycerol glycerophosphotransferase family protein [Nocardioides rotundus]|uniref:CDP-glycerol glycerophosphotransferase family protein n=1 Tax=Nocardioides rotundus TaxID=1774216 RepID=UPI001CC1B4FE|nr:CDP-glycerol glycerophosphotransferase family protein [Nocardioides rotundus]UAL30589.1 CDP-glycerol glycerophosphotransferase family protein [Nocardioides rotundus]
MTTALFESWRGQFNDNPREIYERLLDRLPGTDARWVGGDALPQQIRGLRRHSPAHLWFLRRAGLFVTNDILTQRIPGSPHGTYLQTWHGSPLKLLGFDERSLAYAGASEHLRRVERDVKSWDVLLSQSPAVTPYLRSAFGFDGPVWECGYPRNDVLRSPEAPEIRSSTRAALGLDDDDVVVLSAPTWRDYEMVDGHSTDTPPVIDYDDLVARLPEGVVVLARMHKNVQKHPDATGPGFRDVSAFPDINHLFLACDVLVSDYSSAIFDFAATRKPIICYVPDLERYEETRGFYVDYQEWAPGPVVRTVEDLAQLLADAGLVGQAHGAKLEQFIQTYCPLDDGNAGERVVERLIREGLV